MSEQVFAAWRPHDRETGPTWLLLAFVILAGAVLRFWGLGNIGLHGDEDVMALATRGILETGAPIIPSGMYYPRALPQLYLMALSVAAFGDSEWALRLPSAIAGTLMIAVAYWLARRFLTVRWSILFAAAVALLPSLIALSQTARMYVFFMAFAMLFAIAVFRWERTESMVDYCFAIAACVASLLFHALAVFAALLFFWPGLLKGSRRLFALGAAAFAICVVVFKLLGDWTSTQYFPLVSQEAGGGSAAATLQNQVGLVPGAAGIAVIALAAAAAWLSARRRRYDAAQTSWFVFGIALLAAAGVLAVFIQYHLAALAWFFGTIFYVRSGRGVIAPALLAVGLLALFGWHAYAAWNSPDVQSLLNLAEALAGYPKPLPYFTLFLFSPLGVLVYALITVYFGISFARGRPLPDHCLLFLIAVFTPLFLMGWFEDSYVPLRYIAGLLPFFALSVFAGIRHLVVQSTSRGAGLPAIGHTIAAVVAMAVFIDPAELRRNVNPHYPDFPYLTEHRGVDHKGAAAFVIEQGSDQEDVVIVMDSQQQGYYLQDRMDYYMRSLTNKRNSSFMRNGQMLNLYTGAPQIASGDELARVVTDSAYDEILVVGSGEIEDNLELLTANGIWSTMQRFGFEEAWTGRDGATTIWRYRPAARAGAGTAGDRP